MGMNIVCDLDPCHCLSSAPPCSVGARRHPANARRIIWNNVLGRMKEQLVRLRLALCWRRRQTPVPSCEICYKSSYFMKFTSHQHKPRFYFRGFPPLLRHGAVALCAGLHAQTTLGAVWSCVHPQRRVHLIDSVRNARTLEAPGRLCSSPWQQRWCHRRVSLSQGCYMSWHQ